MQESAVSFRYPSPSDEDLHGLSRLAYSVSATACGACRNYHVMWPYLRAVQANGNGVEFAWDVEGRLLDEAAGRRAQVRWMLAGSADAGLIAMVTAATRRARGVAHSVTVVDQCNTPLALVRSYAEAVRQPVEIVRHELLDFQRDGAFDVIMLHHLMNFFDEGGRASLLRKVRSWLAPGGRAIISTTSRGDGSENSVATTNRGRWRKQMIRDASASGRIELPEDVEVFLARLDNMNEMRRSAARSVGWTLDDYVGAAREAGLTVIDLVDLPFSHQELDLFGAKPNPRTAIIAARGE